MVRAADRLVYRRWGMGFGARAEGLVLAGVFLWGLGRSHSGSEAEFGGWTGGCDAQSRPPAVPTLHRNSLLSGQDWDYAWNVGKIFWACLLHWTRCTGVYDHFPASIKENPHFRQVEEHGFQVLFDSSKFDETIVRTGFGDDLAPKRKTLYPSWFT